MLPAQFLFELLLSLTTTPIWHNLRHMSHFIQSIDSVLKKLEGAYAPNTIRSYHSDNSQFVDWCLGAGRTPFPLYEGTLIQYLECVHESYAFTTLHRRITSIRRVNRLLGYEDIPQAEAYRLTLRRIKRSKPIRSRQARGINRDLLLRAIAAQPDSIVGTRNRALLSMGYDFLARRSELTALRREDVEFDARGGLRGVIRRSKTDPYGRGRLVFGSERSAKLLRKWLRKKPRDINWLFCSVNHGRCLSRALCGRSVSDIVKRAVIRTRGTRPQRRIFRGTRSASARRRTFSQMATTSAQLCARADGAMFQSQCATSATRSTTYGSQAQPQTIN
jgi:integrase/recombinase XerD